MNFLEEFEQLRLKTPRLYNINIGSENSDYCTHSDKNKNCYLLFAANFNEDCLYGGIVLNSRDCVDCNYCDSSELCFECVDIDHCYNCRYSQDLKNCSDCTYCYDCIGCQNCFGCAGLRQKQYYFFNESLSREEYFKKMGEEDWQRAEERFQTIQLQTPRRSSHFTNCQNCMGDYIHNGKNCYMGFNTYHSEDCFYTQDVIRTKDSMDLTFSDGTELCYECFSLGLNTYNCNFSNYIRTCSDCEYSELLFNCKHCFGCVGLQSKEFYILNQPYSRDEYFKKVAETKKQMRADGSYGKHLPTTYKYEDTAAVYWK